MRYRESIDGTSNLDLILDAQDQGRADYKLGLGLSANPYYAYDERAAWECGWWDAKQESEL